MHEPKDSIINAKVLSAGVTDIEKSKTTPAGALGNISSNEHLENF
jgi:hypothetical protein